MANPLEYAPESVGSVEKKAYEMLERWQELFGDDEVSLSQITEQIGSLGPNIKSETISERLEQLVNDKMVESLDRDGKQLYRLTMDGIRHIESTRMQSAA